MICKRGAYLFFVLSLLLAAGRAAALPVVGDGRDLWLVLAPNDDTFRVMHRDPDDAPNTYRLAARIIGRPAVGGLAAASDELWVVTQDLWVRSVSVLTPTDPLMPRYDQPRTHKALPRPGVSLRSLAASDVGPWALVHVVDARTLKEIDARAAPNTPQENDRQTDDADADDPANADAAPPVDDTTTPPAETDDQSTTADDAAVEPNPAAPVAVDRLLRLLPTGWAPLPLPADWRSEAASWIVMTGRNGDHPDLVTMNADRTQLVVYRHDGQTWKPKAYDVPITDDVQFIALQGQLVYARRDTDSETLHITLMLLRPDGAYPVGTFDVADAQADRWQIAAADNAIALVSLGTIEGGQPVHQWTRMLLTGQVDHPTAALSEDSTLAVEVQLQRFVLIMATGVAMVVMFSIWRNPNWTKLALPPTLVPADLVRRGGAAVIDFAPGAIVAMVVFKLNLRELITGWPGLNGQWTDVMPATIATGVFIAHTMLSELFTASTVGKKLLGIRIVAVDGKPPHLWQILFRNLLKAADAAGWFVMLIFPIISPAHQRLGDMLARTVVVTDAPPTKKTDDQPEPGDDG